ncbi:dynamin family protein [Fuchsiella alkaliacetigena]|nr:dynamin family protein [Fuchsiella alkaliacetigena]
MSKNFSLKGNAENLINIYLEKLKIKPKDYNEVSGLTWSKDKAEVELRLKKLSKFHFEFGWLYINLKNYKYLLIADIIYFSLLFGCFEKNKEFIYSIKEKLKIKNEDYSNILEFLKKLYSRDLLAARKFFEEKLSKGKFSLLNYFHNKVEKSLKERNKEEYKVLISSTMNAGKSTLINSLLGKELLPAKNSSCTSKHIKIVQNFNLDNFIGYSQNKEGQKTIKAVIDNQTVESWNEDENIDFIYLEGSIPLLDNLEKKIIFIDTPGSNSCTYKEHRQITEETIKNENFDELIYILDATQLATNDDQEFLNDLVKICAEKEFNKNNIKFLVNKLDKLDLEAGECIEVILEEAKEFLMNSGINDPIIIPTSAYVAKLFNSVLAGESLSKKEEMDFRFLHSIFNSKDYNLSNYLMKQMPGEVFFDIERVENKTIRVGKEEFKSKSILKALSNTGIQELLMTLNISGRNKQ